MILQVIKFTVKPLLERDIISQGLHIFCSAVAFTLDISRIHFILIEAVLEASLFYTQNNPLRQSISRWAVYKADKEKICVALEASRKTTVN